MRLLNIAGTGKDQTGNSLTIQFFHHFLGHIEIHMIHRQVYNGGFPREFSHGKMMLPRLLVISNNQIARLFDG